MGENARSVLVQRINDLGQSREDVDGNGGVEAIAEAGGGEKAEAEIGEVDGRKSAPLRNRKQNGTNWKSLLGKRRGQNAQKILPKKVAEKYEEKKRNCTRFKGL